MFCGNSFMCYMVILQPHDQFYNLMINFTLQNMRKINPEQFHFQTKIFRLLTVILVSLSHSVYASLVTTWQCGTNGLLRLRLQNM